MVELRSQRFSFSDRKDKSDVYKTVVMAMMKMEIVKKNEIRHLRHIRALHLVTLVVKHLNVLEWTCFFIFSVPVWHRIKSKWFPSLVIMGLERRTGGKMSLNSDWIGLKQLWVTEGGPTIRQALLPESALKAACQESSVQKWFDGWSQLGAKPQRKVPNIS